MKRDEFIQALRGLLYQLPPDELEAALQYYREYFDDAGPENEQRVLEELGSPPQVAAQILSDCADRYAPAAGADYGVPNYSGHGYASGYGASLPRRRLSWWLISLLILFSPAIFALALTAVILAITLITVFLILILCYVLIVIALILGGLGGLLGIPYVFVIPLSGPLYYGTALFSIGLGLMLVPSCIRLLTRGIPATFRFIANIISKRRPNR